MGNKDLRKAGNSQVMWPAFTEHEKEKKTKTWKGQNVWSLTCLSCLLSPRTDFLQVSLSPVLTPTPVTLILVHLSWGEGGEYEKSEKWPEESASLDKEDLPKLICNSDLFFNINPLKR